MDEWLDMRWHVQASMLLEVGFTLAGEARDAAPVPPFINPHILTPESASYPHSFYTRQPGAEAEAMMRLALRHDLSRIYVL